jgi:hypothetical protein
MMIVISQLMQRLIMVLIKIKVRTIQKGRLLLDVIVSGLKRTFSAGFVIFVRKAAASIAYIAAWKPYSCTNIDM